MEPVDLNLSREILYSTLGKIIISKSFQLIESDIYISNRSLALIHGIDFPSNKPEKRIKFSDSSESYKARISRLVDLDQIIDILQPSLTSSSTHRMEIQQTSVLVKNELQSHFYYLGDFSRYDDLNRSDVSDLACMKALMVLACDYYANLNEIIDVVNKERILDGSYHSLLIEKLSSNEFKQSAFRRMHRANIQQFILQGLKSNKPEKKLTDLLKSILLMIDSGSRENNEAKLDRLDFWLQYEMITNVVNDNAQISNTDLFHVSESDISYFFLYGDGKKHGEVNRKKLIQRIEKKIEGGIICDPLFAVSFSCLKMEFEFHGRKGKPESYENLLVIYDYATKRVFKCVYLSGEATEFISILRDFFEGINCKVPQKIFYDPSLIKYFNLLSEVLIEIGVTLIPLIIQDARINNFIKYFWTNPSDPIQFRVRQNMQEHNCFTFILPEATTDDYENTKMVGDAIEAIPRFLLNEFNQPKEAYRIISLGPIRCFSKMKSNPLTTLSGLQYALLFHKRHEGRACGKNIFVKIKRNGVFYIYCYFTKADITENKCIVLLDVKNPDRPSYLSRARKYTEIKFHGKYQLVSEYKMNFEEDATLPFIIDAKKEIAELIRREFGIELTSQEKVQSKTRILRRKK